MTDGSRHQNGYLPAPHDVGDAVVSAAGAAGAAPNGFLVLSALAEYHMHGRKQTSQSDNEGGADQKPGMCLQSKTATYFAPSLSSAAAEAMTGGYHRGTESNRIEGSADDQHGANSSMITLSHVVQDRLVMLLASWAQCQDHTLQEMAIKLTWHCVQLAWINLDGYAAGASPSTAAAQPCRTTLTSAALHVLVNGLSRPALKLLVHMTSNGDNPPKEFFAADILCSALAAMFQHTDAASQTQAEAVHWSCNLVQKLQQQYTDLDSRVPSLFQPPGLLGRGIAPLSGAQYQALDVASDGRLSILTEWLLKPHLASRRGAAALPITTICRLLQTLVTALAEARRGHAERASRHVLQRAMRAYDALLCSATGNIRVLADMEQLQGCFSASASLLLSTLGTALTGWFVSGKAVRRLIPAKPPDLLCLVHRPSTLTFLRSSPISVFFPQAANAVEVSPLCGTSFKLLSWLFQKWTFAYPGVSTLRATVAMCGRVWSLRNEFADATIMQSTFACLDAACRASTETTKQQPCLPVATKLDAAGPARWVGSENGLSEMCTVSDAHPSAISEFDSHAAALAALQGMLCDDVMERLAITLLSEARPNTLPHTLWQDSLALLLRVVGSVCPADHLPRLLQAIQKLHLLPRASQLAELPSSIVQTMAALAVTLHLALQPSVNPPSMHSIVAVCAQPLAALASRVSFADISSCQVGKPKRLPGTVGASIAFIALDAEGWAKIPLRPSSDESKNAKLGLTEITTATCS